MYVHIMFNYYIQFGNLLSHVTTFQWQYTEGSLPELGSTFPVSSKETRFCQSTLDINLHKELEAFTVQNYTRECFSVQIIQKMSSALGYKAASTYLSCHLPFLVNQWLDLDYPLNTFPYHLLQCNSVKQFYRWVILCRSFVF